MCVLVNTKHLVIDIMYRPRIISLGIDMGNNLIIRGKMKNFFMELSILFFTLGIEIKW